MSKEIMLEHYSTALFMRGSQKTLNPVIRYNLANERQQFSVDGNLLLVAFRFLEWNVLIVSIRGMCIRQWWSKTCWWQDCTCVLYLPKTDVYLPRFSERNKGFVYWAEWGLSESVWPQGGSRLIPLWISRDLMKTCPLCVIHQKMTSRTRVIISHWDFIRLVGINTRFVYG